MPVSFTKTEKTLPKELTDLLRSAYAQPQYEQILRGYMAKRPVTLRANTLKTDVRTVLSALWDARIKCDRVPWYEDALIIKNARERDIEKLNIYNDGHIYLQSLSSMLPPLALNLRQGMSVLDMAAAPGGKTVQTAALLNNSGFILANEIDAIRAERLRYNISLQGVEAQVRLGDGARLEGDYAGTFDRVLLDAPCSGTGTVDISSPGTYRAFSSRMLAKLLTTQRRLLAAAVGYLKTGGRLVYSTCSVLPQENEENMLWFRQTYKNIKPVPHCLILPQALNKTRMPEALLILPDELYEGFFISAYEKVDV